MDNGRHTGKISTDYAKYHLTKAVKIREDGLRVDPRKKTYEWWYTDSEYEDGTKVVCIFFSKKAFITQLKPNPTCNIEITLPDGTSVRGSVSEGNGQIIHSSRKKCDVSIKDCFIRYEDGVYKVGYKDESIVYNTIFHPELAMWRPKNGHIDMDGKYFAWFVGAPSAAVEADLTIDGKTRKLKGNGYHDHNWGNTNMFNLFDHWYWCRAKVGDYTIINSDIIAKKKYGYKRYPIFLIARDGKILTDEEDNTIILREDTQIHPQTQKFIDNKLTFINQAPDQTEYRVEYHRKKDITGNHQSRGMEVVLRKMLHLFGLDPSYVRCVGTVTLTITKDGEKEVYRSEGLWEQMFFGTNKTAHIEE